MTLTIRPDRNVAQLGLPKTDEEIMSNCVAMSADVWTGLVDGKIACMWGVAPPTLLSNRAYLWLFTTDLVKDHQFLLVRHSQVAMEKILQDYEVVKGHCLVGEARSIRWIKWLGGKFGEPEGLVLPFEIRRQ